MKISNLTIREDNPWLAPDRNDMEIPQLKGWTSQAEIEEEKNCWKANNGILLMIGRLSGN